MAECTPDALLPEVKSYLAAIAEAHGEPPPKIDDALMLQVLAGLLEQGQEQPVTYQSDAEAVAAVYANRDRVRLDYQRRRTLRIATGT